MAPMSPMSPMTPPPRPHSTLARGGRPPSIHRVFSAGHINDSSVYYDHAEDTSDEESEESLPPAKEVNSSDSSNRYSATTYTSNRYEAHSPYRSRNIYNQHGQQHGQWTEHDDEEQDEDETGEVAEVRGGIPDVRDVEKSAPELKRRATNRSNREKDPNLIAWDGEDDPANPKNWSTKRKWAATGIISSFTFISPVSSSMVAPALSAMSADFGVTNTVVAELMLSIFVLAYAIGPLFLGPLSEVYGRVPVLQLSNLFYLCFNLGCGFAKTKGQMLAFRFLSGLGGSAPLAIGGGVLGDCWRPEQRGRAVSIYSLAPLLGPAVGPVAGGFITEKTTWRWVFWATCIADALIQLFGLFFLQETYAPKLLAIKAKKLRKETGNEALHTEFESPELTLQVKLKTAMVRPFILLGTQPIIQVLAFYMAYLYGLMYLVLATFPTLWEDRYGESVGIGGLNYIALGVGFFLGAQIAAPINDLIYRRLKAKNNGVGLPEFRCFVMMPGALLVPAGLFLYGWSAQERLHWIVPDIGAGIFAAGVIVGFQSIQTYIVDAYTKYAASGVAAATVLRSLAGFGFPLFATAFYNALGYGWGNSVLGFVAIALGIPAPFLLWKYGGRLRAKSQYAAGS